MDKNIIRNQLASKFLTEESTPGIDVTKKAQKQSEKINKAAVKDIDKGLANYEKSIEKNTGKTTKMPVNKFNYNGDKEKEYHDQMEIRNGQEMVQYDREPNKDFKDRAEEAIAGSSRMGNNPEWANVVVAGQGGDPSFGKNLVKTIKAATKKRQDAEYRVMSFGDDIETVPKGSKPMGKHSALAEGELSSASRNIEYKKPYGTEDEYDFKNSEEAKEPEELKEDDELKKSAERYRKDMEGKKYGTGDKKNSNPYGDDKEVDLQRENNNNPKIKEGMKRLNFKKEFNGVGNALKMIPEGYKVDNKVFEMADGNESYKIRWEGTLSEGRAVVLTAANKMMVNEDMQKMKHLMGYKSEKTLGLVKGNARLNENAVFNDIYAKSKILLEGEEIEGQKAEVKDADKSVSVAKEAKKHIQGTTSTDKGTQAPKAKTSSLEALDSAKKQAPEAKKHVEGSVDGKIGMGLGEKAPEGEWDQISMPQGAAHGNLSKTSYAAKPATGEWDKISVPQASDAKKHVSMSEGVTLGGVYYGPIEVKKKTKLVNENVLGYTGRNIDDFDVINTIPLDDSDFELNIVFVDGYYEAFVVGHDGRVMNSIAYARNEGNLYSILQDRGVNIDFNPENYDDHDEDL